VKLRIIVKLFFVKNDISPFCQFSPFGENSFFSEKQLSNSCAEEEDQKTVQ
jgi:hypothetical protein